eukprot:667244-Rhodomonas_salina.1
MRGSTHTTPGLALPSTTSFRATSARPSRAASSSGVQPSPCTASTSAPASKSSPTAFTSANASDSSFCSSGCLLRRQRVLLTRCTNACSGVTHAIG